MHDFALAVERFFFGPYDHWLARICCFALTLAPIWFTIFAISVAVTAGCPLGKDVGVPIVAGMLMLWFFEARRRNDDDDD